MGWRGAVAFLALCAACAASAGAPANDGDAAVCFQAALGGDRAGLPACDRAVAGHEGPSATLAANLANRGYVLLADGQSERAMADFERALQISSAVNSPRGDILLGAGRAKLALGDEEAAEQLLLKAREYPELAARADAVMADITATARARQRIGADIRQRRGAEIAAAESAIRKLDQQAQYGSNRLEASRQVQPIKVWLAAVLAGRNIGLPPLHEGPISLASDMATLADALERAGRFDEALELVDKRTASYQASLRRPIEAADIADGIEDRADLLARAGRLEQALAEFRRSNELSRSPSTLRRISQLQLAMLDHDGALASWNQADQLQAELARVRQPAASSVPARFDRAIKRMNAEIARSRPADFTGAAIIQILRERGEHDKALALALRNADGYLRLWRQNGEIGSRSSYAGNAVLAANIQAETGDYRSAEAILAQVIANTGMPRYVRLSQGNLALRQGNVAAAEQLFKERTAWCNGNEVGLDPVSCAASVRVSIADYYARAGMKARALESWNAALPDLVRKKLLTIPFWGIRRRIDSLR